MGGIADPGLAASTLVSDALAAGGTDNATAIVIDVWDGDTIELEVEADYRSPDDRFQRGRGAHRIDRTGEVDRMGG
jgi:serine/threonine protein phosphatase PrpC